MNVEKVPSIQGSRRAYVMIYDGEMKIRGKAYGPPLIKWRSPRKI